MGLGMSCCRDVKCHCTIYVLGSREKKGSVGCALAVELLTEIFPLWFSWEAGISQACAVPKHRKIQCQTMATKGSEAQLGGCDWFGENYICLSRSL